MEMTAHVSYVRGSLGPAIGLMTIGGICAAELRDSAEVHFRQGRANLDPNFGGNGQRLDSMKRKLRADSRLRVKSVRVTGSASPEGSVAINRSLSHRRADAIISSLGLPDSIASFNYIGRDWAGLARMVEADDQTPSRSEVLSLLREINSSLSAGEPDNAANLQRLKSVGGGVPYAYMYSRMFPSLRFSRLSVEFEPQIRPMIVNAGVPSYIGPDIRVTESPIFLPEPARDSRKPFYMALKTNMLYDALAVPNVGIEFYVGRNWSLTGDWTYAWWDKDSSHRYWRVYGGTVGVRRWFGRAARRKPLTGHHLGVNAGAVTFDFEWGGKGYMGGKPGRNLWDRCMATASVEYGYSLPVGRRLNTDFTLGVGYVGGKVVDYVPDGDRYLWQQTRHVNWFGPTKAEVALVWLIGHGNYNKRGGLK